MASSARYNTVLLPPCHWMPPASGWIQCACPADGKVPIYQDGDTLVLSPTASQVVGEPAEAPCSAGRD